MPKKNAVVEQLESLVYPILEINYPDPVFSIAAHPTKPWIAQGMATGHVFMTKYNSDQLEESATTEKSKLVDYSKLVSQTTAQKWWTAVDLPSPEGNENVSCLWKTKRHKGACRHIVFDPLDEGSSIYTVGSDHIIKKALSETGQVTAKVDVLKHFVDENDAVTKLCCSPTIPLVIVGTELGHILVFDLKLKQLKYKLEGVHDDAVSSILAMPEVSNYHYITLGLTTLAHIDIRKGIVTQLDDQGDELLAMAYPSDNIRGNKNDTVLVTHGEGIVTIWKNSKNKLMDQLTRIKLNKGVSIDAIVATLNEDDQGVNPPVDCVWCGDLEGLIYKVNYKRGKIIETRVHLFSDEIGYLDIDYQYRLISGGMDTVKIWLSKEAEEIEEVDGDSGDDSDDNDSDDDSDIGSDDDSENDSDGNQEEMIFR